MEKLIKVIEEEITILEKWANDSLLGGWSTHQVKPQQERANYLKSVLYDLTRNKT